MPHYRYCIANSCRLIFTHINILYCINISALFFDIWCRWWLLRFLITMPMPLMPCLMLFDILFWCHYYFILIRLCYFSLFFYAIINAAAAWCRDAAADASADAADAAMPLMLIFWCRYAADDAYAVYAMIFFIRDTLDARCLMPLIIFDADVFFLFHVTFFIFATPFHYYDYHWHNIFITILFIDYWLSFSSTFSLIFSHYFTGHINITRLAIDVITT